MAGTILLQEVCQHCLEEFHQIIMGVFPVSVVVIHTEH